MEAVVLQSFGDVLLDYATLLEGPQIDDELVGALAVRACASYNHETAARRSDDHEDGATVAWRQVEVRKRSETDAESAPRNNTE